MSRLSDMMYGSLTDAQHVLNHASPDLNETQGALINLIGVVLDLQARISRLEAENSKGATR